MTEEIETPEGAENRPDDTQGQQPPAPEQGQQSPPEQPAEQVSEEARLWGMLCHLLGLVTCFIAPLIIWLVKKDEEPFVDKNGKEALNFQITVCLAGIACAFLSIICIGIPLAIAVGICDLVFCIVAAVKANSGQVYRYPVSIRFVR